MSDEDSVSGSRADWIVDRVLRGFIGIARAMPYGLRVPAFAAVNRRIISPLAGYHKRARANLALIHPDRSADWHTKIATQAVENAGRVLIENYSNPTFMNRAAEFDVSGAGLAPVLEASKAGRPVILATGHFGNYEAARAALIARGVAAGGLYRPMSNPYFNVHYRKTMEVMGPPVFAQGRSGTKALLKFLKSGGAAVILTDVYVPNAPFIPFLGRPARTTTSAADLALNQNALLVPFYATRIENSLDYKVELEAPIPASDPLTMTKALVESLEARITQTPGQWFWVHRRWKGKPGADVV